MVSSLPLTKAKIASITGAAIRAGKYYKHVVKLVEEFILKSNESYKVTGLYVFDAILRQSRLCNRERDLYSPRFLRNIDDVFLALSKCKPEDKPMISLVLQFWSKEKIYSKDLLSILQDLVDDPARPDLRASGMPLFVSYFFVARKIISGLLTEYESRRSKASHVSQTSEEYLQKAKQVCQISEILISMIFK